MSLADHHRAMLEASAVAEDVWVERGYWTATERKELERWFGATQRRVPALVIPTFDVHGDLTLCQLRPDQPRVVKGKVRKYEMPSGAKLVLDVPKRVRPKLGDPTMPLVITEGARKADAAVSAGLYAVSLVGVWGWRGKNGDGGTTALPDWESVALNGRTVYLAFDSDAMAKVEVHRALERLAAFLRSRRAETRFVYLPWGEGGAKVGLDDYLADGHGRDDVLALATDELRPLVGDPSSNGKANDYPEVDGAALLDDIAHFIERYMVLPSEEVARLLALWVFHTWAFEAAVATPYLRITSAVRECGKSLLLEILDALARRGWYAVTPSTAVLYRVIEQDRPTLLLDELDNYDLTERAEALAVLNAGYRPGARVPRCGENGKVEHFSVYCPKAFAGLDKQAISDTLLSRSITVRLERKLASEHREMWLGFRGEKLAEPLRERCEAWAHHHADDALLLAEPELHGLVNRAAELWWSLLVIAEHVGGPWPERAEKAIKKLATGGDDADESGELERLLADIRDAFGGAETIFTRGLLETLNGLDESPWGARRDGKGLDARGLARMLRPFGIKPRTVRVEGVENTSRGYHRDQFDDTFARYLSRSDTSDTGDTTQPQSERDVSDVSDVSDETGGGGNVDNDTTEEATEAQQRIFDEYEGGSS